MLLAVVGTLDRAAKRNAVHREGGNVADTSEAFLLADVNVDDGLARGNGVGDIGRAVLKDRGERDIFALIFHTEHFHQGEVQPACRTGKHGADVFARNAVVVLGAETGITLGEVGVSHRLIGVNGIHGEEREVCEILCERFVGNRLGSLEECGSRHHCRVLEYATVFSVAGEVRAGSRAVRQLAEIARRAELNARVGHEIFLDSVEHDADLIVRSNAREDGPAASVEEVRAVDIFIGGETVAACAEVGVTALAYTADQGSCEEVALPAMLLNSVGERRGKRFDFVGKRRFSEKIDHRAELVVRDLEQECIHHALGIVALEGYAVFRAVRFELRQIAFFLFGSVNPVVVELQAVVPVSLVEQRQTMRADGDLTAVGHDGKHGVENASRLFGACDREFRGEEGGIARQRDVAVNCLNEPQAVIGAHARLLAALIEVMVCVTHLVNVGDPVAEHFARQTVLAHTDDVVERSEHILNFTEADLSVGFLRPCERTGYVRLIVYLEGQVVVNVSVKISVPGLYLEEACVFRGEVLDLLQGAHRFLGILVFFDQIGEHTVENVILAASGDRHADEAVSRRRALGGNGDLLAYRKERNDLRYGRASEVCHVLRLFQRTVADEVHVVCGIFVHRFAVSENDGKALEGLEILRERAGTNDSGLAVHAKHTAFPSNARVNGIAHDGFGGCKTEHTREYDLQLSLAVGRIFHGDVLCFHSLGHTLLLRKNENGSDDPQTAFGLIGHLGIVVRVTANGSLDVGMYVCGIEDLLAVFNEVELAVTGLAVLLGCQRIARGGHLSCRGTAEGASAEGVQSALGRGEKRRGEADTVTDQKVDVKMRADLARLEVNDVIAVFRKRACAAANLGVDRRKRGADIRGDLHFAVVRDVTDRLTEYEKAVFICKILQIASNVSGIHHSDNDGSVIRKIASADNGFPVNGLEGSGIRARYLITENGNQLFLGKSENVSGIFSCKIHKFSNPFS